MARPSVTHYVDLCRTRQAALIDAGVGGSSPPAPPSSFQLLNRHPFLRVEVGYAIPIAMSGTLLRPAGLVCNPESVSGKLRSA